MALNPIVYTEKIVRSFLKYQHSAYPFADPDLNEQMRQQLSLDSIRRTPLLKGPYISLSRGFREGAIVAELGAEGVFHPHMPHLLSAYVNRVYGHRERARRANRDRYYQPDDRREFEMSGKNVVARIIQLQSSK